MRLRITTEPQQGSTFGLLAAVATTAEALGFDGFFCSDHFVREGEGSGLPGPADAWIALAGLARHTSRIRLGTLVSPVTFRMPAMLATGVAQVDEMSGGRVELGFGAGWYEPDHTCYGIPMPSTTERFDRLAEALAIVVGLWGTPADGAFHHHGKHYQLSGARGLGRRPRLLLGGEGKRRTPLLAARYADEFNLPACAAPQDATAAFDRVLDRCAEIGRSDAPVFSVLQTVCCGRTDPEVSGRAARIGLTVEHVRTTGLAGSPDEVVDRLGRFGAAGAEQVYLQLLDLTDLAQLELVADRVLPQLPKRMV